MQCCMLLVLNDPPDDVPNGLVIDSHEIHVNCRLMPR